MATRGATYEAITHACYWNYFRIYVPHGSRFVHAAPMPLPQGAIFAVQGGGTPGSDTISQFASYSKTVIAGLMVIPAQETYSVEFLYQLPTDVIIPLSGNRYLYRLMIQSQPGVIQTEKHVTMNLSAGYNVMSWNPEPSMFTPNSATWVITQPQDVKIEVEFDR